MERPVMYILANKALGMSAGKLAAQVGHGVGRALFDAISDPDRYQEWAEYQEKGETKIVLECRDTEHLLMAERYLNEHGIKTFLVIDEGRTEIPAHTPTVLATEILDKNAPEVQFALGEFKTYKEEPSDLPERYAAMVDALGALSFKNKEKVLREWEIRMGYR